MMNLHPPMTGYRTSPVLHTETLDASLLASDLHDQVDGLALLASMSRPDASLDGETWANLLRPIAEQLKHLRCILERNALSAVIELRVSPENPTRKILKSPEIIV